MTFQLEVFFKKTDTLCFELSHSIKSSLRSLSTMFLNGNFKLKSYDSTLWQYNTKKYSNSENSHHKTSPCSDNRFVKWSCWNSFYARGPWHSFLMIQDSSCLRKISVYFFESSTNKTKSSIDTKETRRRYGI